MKVLAIPDLHFPFHSERGLSFAYRAALREQPDAIVQLGDLYDQFSFSRYPHDSSAVGMTPEQELDRGRERAQEMWRNLLVACPKARLIQICDGNHDTRLHKRILESCPGAGHLSGRWFHEQMTFPGVECRPSGFILDGVMYMHGERRPGAHAPWAQMSVVTGHCHRAGIRYFANSRGPYWEMQCGWLGNRRAHVFSYRLQTKISDTHIAVGLIYDRKNPRVISP